MNVFDQVETTVVRKQSYPSIQEQNGFKYCSENAFVITQIIEKHNAFINLH